MSRPALAGWTVATLLIAGCSAEPEEPQEDLHVARRHLVGYSLLTAEVVAESALELTAPDVGIRPLEIRTLVRNGTPVERGDALVAFDNGAVAQRLEEHRLEVLEGQAELDATRSDVGSEVSEADFELERRRAALEKATIDASIPRGLTSDEEYERLQLELRKAEASLDEGRRALENSRLTADTDIRLAELALREAEAELAQVDGSIEELTIEAPFRGLALLARTRTEERLWQEGDLVQPGETLIALPDLDTLALRARLFDVDEGTIEPGLPAIVRLTAFPDVTFRARVRTVDPIAFQRERGSTTRIFWVMLDLEDPDPTRMRPGTTALVSIERPLTSGEPAPLTAPRASIYVPPGASPRLRLEDGSWRGIELGPCSDFHCVVTGDVEEGAALGRAS